MKRLFLGTGAMLAALIALICGLIVYPQPLFAYSLSGHTIKLYSDAPIDEAGGRAFIDETQSILARWPVKPGSQAETVSLFVVNSAWRRRILFGNRPHVGGLVYYPLSRSNAFLSGADFENGLLVAPSGAIMPPPRTLAYYGAHEAAHLLTGRQAGTLGYLKMPEWIREGVADYIALEGAPDYPALAEAASGLRGEATLAVINRFGVYPKYRLLVAFFLEQKGWSLEQLLRSGMSLEDGERLFAAAGTASGLRQELNAVWCLGT
jgi:hypothetical protein